MNSISYFCGEICKLLFPINGNIFFGNPNSSVCICTLSSMDLLHNIAKSEIMNEIFLVGRLFSENKGIDSLIDFVNSNLGIKTIIICGNETNGHKAGSSLLAVYKYGIDSSGRIINSTSSDPVLASSNEAVQKFREQVKIINQMGVTNLDKIFSILHSLKN